MPFKLDFAVLASEQLSDLKSTNAKKHIAVLFVFELLSNTREVHRLLSWIAGA